MDRTRATRRDAFMLICLDALWAITGFAGRPNPTHHYAAPDKSGIVEIVSAKRDIKGAGYESRVGIHSGDRQQLCTIDYSSEDGQHGFRWLRRSGRPTRGFSFIA